MTDLDERMAYRLAQLKLNRWPKILELRPSTLDLSGGRIREDMVSTLDEFEQCWRYEYHQDIMYNFLNHILASGVAFQVRSIGRKRGIDRVQIDDVEILPVIEHAKMSVDYALECKDIASVEELFEGEW